MATQLTPGDTIRINGYKGNFAVISIFYNLAEIAIGHFVEIEKCQKKYRGRYVPILSVKTNPVQI